MKSNKYNPFQLRASESNCLSGYDHSEDGLAVFVSRGFAIRAAYVLAFRRYRRQGLRTIKDVTEMFYHGNANLYFAFLDSVLYELNSDLTAECVHSYTEDEDPAYFPSFYLYALGVALGADVNLKEIYDVVRSYDLRPIRLEPVERLL